MLCIQCFWQLYVYVCVYVYVFVCVCVCVCGDVMVSQLDNKH